MITFEPDSPWDVGQLVTLRDGEATTVKRVTAVERADDGMEAQYTLVDASVPEHLYTYVAE
jgi:hypothetical protein